MKCSRHSARELLPQKTQYGVRYYCPVPDCTVICWDGSTSTPADFQTRQARIKAHDAFDNIWKSGQLSQKKAYSKLANFLGVPIKKTHIGYFDYEQCLIVIEFAKKITNGEFEPKEKELKD